MVVVAMPMVEISLSGSVMFCTPTFFIRRKSAGLPMTWQMSLPKASPNPNTTHITLTNPMTMKLWSMVEMTFLGLTMPP